MKILSTNISLPKKIIFNNKTLTTSIFKEPTDKVLEVKKKGYLEMVKLIFRLMEALTKLFIFTHICIMSIGAVF